MDTRRELWPLAVSLLAAAAVIIAKQLYVGDARWWNLVMAVLLLGVLAAYLGTTRR